MTPEAQTVRAALREMDKLCVMCVHHRLRVLRECDVRTECARGMRTRKQLSHLQHGCPEFKKR